MINIVKIIVIFVILFLLLKKILMVIMKYRESYKTIHTFNCVTVNTNESRKKGLMYRKKPLHNKEGMLFDFKISQQISLWMKNTYIPLDAIFMDNNGKVLDLKQNLKPKSKINIVSTKKSKYVLEVNNNTIKNNNIKKGDYININKISKLK
tara:strand:+ start:2528 stop:2980 length:453 start_codon:yes stop_codon:yes gene_type:complete